ncbi:ABC transporter permease [Streptomyces venezuelae]|uniref:ABC transporter permease n=1 Tax=Streptomyces venezuelae TaxID=54571 RepID=UPI001238404A|nr:FtsX-like permease family protein [Streptomyces venezuelae]QES09308.1 ABC transporter permease [Streptomyces venezuelae]
MFGLALQTLRHRKSGFVASFLALFLGAVIVAACGGLMETGIRASAPPPRSGTGHAVVLFSPIEHEATRLVSLSAVFGGIAAMVVVFVVGSTLAVLVQQRMREMALLRAVGSLPGQIRLLVVSETLVIGALATALALAPGHYAGRLMLERFAEGGMVSPEIPYRAGWIPLVTAAGAALLAAVAAAWIASRRAALIRPAAALAESGLQRRWISAPRLVFALLCLAGGTALALVTALVMPGSVAASTAGPTAMLWASGVALVCPGLTGALIAVLRPPLRLLPGPACGLAADNVRARAVRTAGAVTPVMLATGLAAGLLYLQTTTDASARDAARDARTRAAVSAPVAVAPAGLADRTTVHGPASVTVGTAGAAGDRAERVVTVAAAPVAAAPVAAAPVAPVVAAPGGGARAASSGGGSADAWINFLLAGTIIGYAMISLVNTLVVAASERREEFALQRLVGATTGQVMRMMSVEALLVAVMGTVLGSLVAAATLVPFRLALDGRWLPGGPVWIYLAIVGLVTALTVVATLVPVRLALRVPPAGAPAAP